MTPSGWRILFWWAVCYASFALCFHFEGFGLMVPTAALFATVEMCRGPVGRKPEDEKS